MDIKSSFVDGMSGKEKFLTIAVVVLVLAVGVLTILQLLPEKGVETKYLPVEVDLSPYNAKIADLESKIQEKDTVIRQLVISISNMRDNERNDVIDHLGIEHLDASGIDKHARGIIHLADSLRRAGHSYYDPIP